MLDQAERLRRMVEGDSIVPDLDTNNEVKKEDKAKIITVTSGKGGVGKSNFVVNLGITLQKQGKKVLIFDADIGMGNDDVLMGVFPKYSMFDVIKGREIEEIVEEGPYGIKLLSGGSGINQIEDLKQEERKIFLDKLENLSGFDYILMDTGAGINRSALAFIACSDEVIVITTPEPTSLTDAYSLIKTADHFKVKDKVKIVVNRALDEEEGMQTYNRLYSVVTKFLNMDASFLGYILDDRKLVKGVREQVPFSIKYPNSDAARCIELISNKILENNKNQGIGAKGLFKKLFKLFA